MWDAVNTKNQEIISSDMTFIDEQVCISFLKNTSNFEVGTCNEFYRPI